MNLPNQPEGFRWLGEERRSAELDRRAEVRGRDRRAVPQPCNRLHLVPKGAGVSSNFDADNAPNDRERFATGAVGTPTPQPSEEGPSLDNGGAVCDTPPTPQPKGAVMITAYVENQARRNVRLKVERSARKAKAIENYLNVRKSGADIRSGLQDLSAELETVRRTTFEDGAGI